MSAWRLLPAALAALTAASPAMATPPAGARVTEATLEQAERAAQRALAARRKAESLSGKLGALGRSIVARERRLDALRKTLRERRRAAATTQLRLAAARRRLSALTTAAQRAAREPTASILAHPDRPLAAARAEMLIRRLADALTAEQRRERRAAIAATTAAMSAAEAESEALATLAALRAEEATVDRLRLEAAAASAASRESARRARADAARLASAAERRGAEELAERERAETERAERLAAAASADAAQQGAAEPPPEKIAPTPGPAPAPVPLPAPAPTIAPPVAAPSPRAPEPPLIADAPAFAPAEPPPPFAEAKGTLFWPVAGEMRRSSRGGTPGATFATPARARVIAPWSGLVVYASDYSSEGMMVIIEPQKGFLVMLVGLASLDLKEGDRVSAGEPLGRMGGAVSSGAEFLVEYSGDPTRLETLYVEMVKEGRPLDPASWFRSAKQEVSSL